MFFEQSPDQLVGAIGEDDGLLSDLAIYRLLSIASTCLDGFRERKSPLLIRSLIHTLACSRLLWLGAARVGAAHHLSLPGYALLCRYLQNVAAFSEHARAGKLQSRHVSTLLPLPDLPIPERQDLPFLTAMNEGNRGAAVRRLAAMTVENVHIPRLHAASADEAERWLKEAGIDPKGIDDELIRVAAETADSVRIVCAAAGAGKIRGDELLGRAVQVLQRPFDTLFDLRDEFDAGRKPVVGLQPIPEQLAKRYEVKQGRATISWPGTNIPVDRFLDLAGWALASIRLGGVSYEKSRHDDLQSIFDEGSSAARLSLWQEILAANTSGELPLLDSLTFARVLRPGPSMHLVMPILPLRGWLERTHRPIELKDLEPERVSSVQGQTQCREASALPLTAVRADMALGLTPPRPSKVPDAAGLSTHEMARVLDGFRRDGRRSGADYWRKRFADGGRRKWLSTHRISAGGGGAQATWNPVSLSEHLLARYEQDKDKNRPLLDDRFRMLALLAPWREFWTSASDLEQEYLGSANRRSRPSI